MTKFGFLGFSLLFVRLNGTAISKDVSGRQLEEFDRKQTPRKTDRSTNKPDQLKSSKGESLQENVRLLFTFLFSKHQKKKNILGLRAIVHLLKNEGKVNQDEENYEQFLLELAAKREEISRLEKQFSIATLTGSH